MSDIYLDFNFYKYLTGMLLANTAENKAVNIRSSSELSCSKKCPLRQRSNVLLIKIRATDPTGYRNPGLMYMLIQLMWVFYNSSVETEEQSNNVD